MCGVGSPQRKRGTPRNRPTCTTPDGGAAHNVMATWQRVDIVTRLPRHLIQCMLEGVILLLERLKSSLLLLFEILRLAACMVRR